MPSQDKPEASRRHFINPHRLFHGVWLPQWLDERPEVSEKAKKLYAYLTYFAGGKGCAWPSFNHLAKKLRISRRYVIQLVKELSAHELIAVTHVNNPAKGHCANLYRFLWHPWMQNNQDDDFRLVVPEEQTPFPAPSSSIAPPSESRTPGKERLTRPDELRATSLGQPEITPLVTAQSPKENNKKRINYRGKVPVPSSSTSPSSAASRPRRPLSDATKIILERRIAELRMEIVDASKRGNRAKADRLHEELVEHQVALGFTPDDPPPKPRTSRKKEPDEPNAVSNWPSPTEVRKTFNELRRSLGWPTKDENL
jgi:Helix-turn-helix domain